MLSYGSPSILFLVDTFNTSRGLSKTGEYLINSVYLNRFVNKNIIDHNFGSEDNFVSKLRKGFLYLTKVVKSIKVNNAVAAYINPRTSGFGLLADFLVIQILKRRFNKSSINKNLSCNHPIVLHLHGVGISNKQPGWFNNWVYKKMFRDVYVMLMKVSM